MNVAIICIGLLGLLLFSLGIAVSLTRDATDTGSGYSPDPTDRLHKVARAHGNTSEYAAMLAILMLVSATRDPAIWALWCMGIATASRYSIAIGLIVGSTLEKPHPLRFIGATGTYLSGLGLAVDVLLSF